MCWARDVLFNCLDRNGPRLLFKGGTSLSKAVGLISRFSEDIDITVFRDDLGASVEVADLDALSGKQRRLRLDAIRTACQTYVAGPMMEQLTRVCASAMPGESFRITADPDDQEGQTLLFWYPVATIASNGDYIRSAVKVKCGAKSAFDPHVAASVTPYLYDDLPGTSLAVTNITTVGPERTFWDKIIILHRLRQWHDRRRQLPQGGQRVSRHYHDIHHLMQLASADTWLADQTLALDCARHARLFFGSPDLGLDSATRGAYTLMPDKDMIAALATD